jgi:hypothetical protein
MNQGRASLRSPWINIELIRIQLLNKYFAQWTHQPILNYESIIFASFLNNEIVFGDQQNVLHVKLKEF